MLIHNTAVRIIAQNILKVLRMGRGRKADRAVKSTQLRIRDWKKYTKRQKATTTTTKKYTKRQTNKDQMEEREREIEREDSESRAALSENPSLNKILKKKTHTYKETRDTTQS